MIGPGVESIADAEAALGRLAESLVLSYVLDTSAATFTLVAEDPDRALWAQRSFIALVFSGVRRVRRDPGNLAELQEFVESYSIADHTRPIVIQHLTRCGCGERRSLELSFGVNFGDVAFAYDTLAGSTRHARAQACGND